MFDVLYNSYTGLIYCTATRDVSVPCDIKSWGRDMVNANSDRALLLPGSVKFPCDNPYKCVDCSFDNNSGCCKVSTFNYNYDASGFVNNYRMDIDNDGQLIETHIPEVKFYSISNNEEFVFNEDYQAYLFKDNTKAVIQFKYCGVFAPAFNNKQISFDITGGIAYKTIVTNNGIAQNNILFSSNISSGNIKIRGNGNGNSINYTPTNTLSIKYVMIKE